MVETIVVNLPANIKAEDETKAQVKIKGPGKASMDHGTTVLETPEDKECWKESRWHNHKATLRMLYEDLNRDPKRAEIY